MGDRVLDAGVQETGERVYVGMQEVQGLGLRVLGLRRCKGTLAQCHLILSQWDSRESPRPRMRLFPVFPVVRDSAEPPQ